MKYLKKQLYRYLDALSFFDDTDRIGKILEIGIQPDPFTFLLKSLGYIIHGVDKVADRAKIVSDKCDIIVKKIDIVQELLPYPSNFDTVLFTELIEHLRFNSRVCFS